MDNYLCWLFFFLVVLSGTGPSSSVAVASSSSSMALFFPSLFKDVDGTGISRFELLMSFEWDAFDEAGT